VYTGIQGLFALPECRGEKVPRFIFVLTFNDLVIALQDHLYGIAKHMCSRREIASLRDVFCRPDCTNQMGIETLLDPFKNEESKHCAYFLRCIGLSSFCQEEKGGDGRIGDAKTIESEKLLKMGKKIRAIRGEIDMVGICSTLACANLEFFTAEGQMPVACVIFVEVFLKLNLSQIARAERDTDEETQHEGVLMA
jgi:hypothetical protein